MSEANEELVEEIYSAFSEAAESVMSTKSATLGIEPVMAAIKEAAKRVSESMG